MSRRAAARRYAISKSVAIKWLERVERDGSREPVGHGGHRAPSPVPTSQASLASGTPDWVGRRLPSLRIPGVFR